MTRRPHTPLLFTLLLLTLPAAAAAQNPLAPPAQPVATPTFQGEWRGDGIVLSLTFDGRTRGYAGTIAVGGGRYACSGEEQQGRLHGHFAVDDQQFAFTVSRRGDHLLLSSDGVDHELRAVAAAPAAAGAALPAWLQNGVRVTYWGGSRSVPGSAQNYIPDPDGNIRIGGKNHKLDDATGSAGAGYSQYDVVDINAGGIGLLVSNYVPTDAQLRNLTSAGIQGLRGDAQRLGEFWIHPAVLAAMPEEKTATSLVRHLRYPLDGKTYDALTTQISGPDSFIRNTYDLATGLLLVHTSSSTGKGGLAPAGNGQAAPAQGVTTIVSSRLVSVRQRALPWAGQKDLPQWLQKGQQLRFAGTCTNSLGQGIVAPWRYDLVLALDAVVGGFVMAQMQTRLDYGYGTAPQETSTPVVYGAGMTGPLWIAPATLRALRGDQVLDEDPVTKRRLRCVGSDGRTTSILEEGPTDGVQFTYDLQSGALVAVAQRLQQGPATIDYQVQLQR